MAKLAFQWKDPDWYDAYENQATLENLWPELHEAGLGEYIAVEYDTETKQATVLRLHRDNL